MKRIRPNGYNIITLCGSTKFKEEFIRVQKELTLQGNIVISVGLFGHSGDEITEEQKEMLDEMHKRKIEMSDEIFVINKGGYIGHSTIREIAYAKFMGKKIRYLEEPVTDIKLVDLIEMVEKANNLKPEEFHPVLFWTLRNKEYYEEFFGVTLDSNYKFEKGIIFVKLGDYKP